MGKVEKYEDLRCWQQVRILVNQVYELLDEPTIKKEFALVDQLKRASISAMTNIAEGFSRYHKKDFIRFLDYAQSSTQEVKSLLYIVLDQRKANPKQVKEIQKNCDHCSALILSLIKYLKNSLAADSNKVSEPTEIYLTQNYIHRT